MALSNLVAVLLRLAGLRRRLQGLDGTRILNTHVRAGLAALIAAAIGWAALHALGNIEALGRLGAFVACLGIGALMLGVYVALLRALRVRELQDLLDPVMARIRRR
jgi:putative peptidoglycan lipid II flippase